MKKKKTKIDILLLLLLITIPSILVLHYTKFLDNDMWYLLSEGRAIIKNGIYYNDILSMHHSFDIVIQNWGSAIIYWTTFSLFKQYGIYILLLISNIILSLLHYKLCMLLSDNHKSLSFILTIIFELFITPFYIVTRPQVFSFIFLLLLIYSLESYIKTKNKKYLICIPLIAFIESNMHASLLLMVFLYGITYIIDSFKIKLIDTEGYPKKPILIAFGIALIASLINPYGFKSLSFIFTSFFNRPLHNLVVELSVYAFNNKLAYLAFIASIFVCLIYFIFPGNKIKIRYICMYFGTLILSQSTVKGTNQFFLVIFFPLAYFLKDIFPRKLKLSYNSKQILKLLYHLTIVISCSIFLILSYKVIPNITFTTESEDTINEINKYGQKEDTIYCDYNIGGYLEYYGYKPYIDPRGEVFLKANNHKYDIIEEFMNLQSGGVDPLFFVEYYHFHFLLINSTDVLYNQMENLTDKYTLIYEDYSIGQRVYARNDVINRAK